MYNGFQFNFYVAFAENFTLHGIFLFLFFLSKFCMRAFYFEPRAAAVVWSARPSLSVTATAASGERTSLG